jgi:DNA-binding transcriptional regulator LsrR (DeoR family)
MSQNVPKKRLKRRLRIQQLIIGLKQGLTLGQIAEKCGVSEKTIDRDMAEWKDNGGFDKWLLSEFLRLHENELCKEGGGQSYHTVADLLKKRLKEQQEIVMQGGNSFVVKILDNSKENSDNPVQDAPEAT